MRENCPYLEFFWSILTRKTPNRGTSGRFEMTNLEMNKIFDQKLCVKAMKWNSR